MNTTLSLATTPQKKLIGDLLREIREIDGSDFAKDTFEQVKALDEAEKLTFEMARELIEKLLKTKRLHVERARAVKAEQVPAQREARPEVPEGRYAVDTEEGHLGFYHVRVSAKGFITVSVLASTTEHELPWKAALGVLRKIAAAGLVEASIRFGQEMGVCGVCNKPLTNPESRELGIGPICRGRLG